MDFSKENAMVERMKAELRKELKDMKFEDVIEGIIAIGMNQPRKQRLDVLCPLALEVIEKYKNEAIYRALYGLKERFHPRYPPPVGSPADYVERFEKAVEIGSILDDYALQFKQKEST